MAIPTLASVDSHVILKYYTIIWVTEVTWRAYDSGRQSNTVKW